MERALCMAALSALVWGYFLWGGSWGGEAWAATVANWRFGRVQISDLGSGQIRIYMSLRNHGGLSQEPVGLSILPWQKAAPSGPPLLSLTDRTRGRHSVVVEAVVSLPPAVLSQGGGNYKLFLQVGETVTDMLPVEGGNPKAQAPERKRFQKQTNL